MHATFKNTQTGQVKQAKIGYSWTYFFWGWWVCLFRGDWKWLIITLLASPCTFGIFWFVFSFMYNKIYVNELLEEGYLPSSATDRDMIVGKGYVTNDIKTADQASQTA